MNQFEKGRASSSDLSRLTGIHRTTVRRMLETLVEDGYVWRSASDDNFTLTMKVRELSEGFTTWDQVSSVAGPIMGELLQKVVWPSSLCVPVDGEMVVVESTHRFSPLSFHRGMVGRHIPILTTASGRAYFSACRPSERAELLQILINKDGSEGQLARDAAFIKQLIQGVRVRGFATNAGEWAVERKTGSIAMPIMSKEKVLGTLNVIYLDQAIKEEQAIRNFAGPLADAVSRIATAIDNACPPQTD